MPLHLRWKADTRIPVEAECIRPDALRGLGLDDVRRLPVQFGNQQQPLGEFFDVNGDTDGDEVVVEGDCPNLRRLGEGMAEGRITIEGNVGMHVGAEMTGGEIVVHGNVTDWLGAEMHGGRIHVHGNAGHLVGAAYRGSRRGMTGGVILVEGRAGNEVGSTMRRGLIAVGGEVGDCPGFNLIAGTILLFGPCGVRPAAGMRRGTVGLFDTTGAPALLSTFRYACTYRPTFLRLYLKRLREWGFPVPEEYTEASYRRYAGDLVALGKGEILVREATN
jgi:formylmethanofuran dehydrogenase subunit C